MSDLAFATASELAELVRKRQVSAVELLSATLARIERYNPALNAVVTIDAQGATTRAREADAALARGEFWGSLHGVPLTIKDSLETAGMRTTSGFPPLAEYVPEHDATAVARLRRAGAIVVGKTNLPVLAGDCQCDNPVFGRTNNPWDLERTPGGSSGGAAAALAAGLTSLELGSDLGGSIRIPAHNCGVCGLKPTDGRVPLSGHIPEPPGAPRGLRHMAVVGPMARSLDDLGLALGLIAGADGRHWETPPALLAPAPQRALNKLRIAWSDEFSPVQIGGETRTALGNLATALARAGGIVERTRPADFDVTAALETWGELFQAEAGSAMPPADEDETESWLESLGDHQSPIERGRALRLRATVRQYTASLMRRDALIAAVESFFDTWDVWLVPVAGVPAVTHRPGGTPVIVDGVEHDYSVTLAGCCMPFNLTGHPVVVIPLATSSDGLPIGVQIVGRRWEEPALLAAARAVATITPPWQPPAGYAG